jgi:hypothetical protein
VADEDDQLPRRDVGRIVQLLERPTLPLRVQHQQVAHLLQVLFRRQVVVDVDAAFELLLAPLEHRRLAGWRERRSRAAWRVYGSRLQLLASGCCLRVWR